MRGQPCYSWAFEQLLVVQSQKKHQMMQNWITWGSVKSVEGWVCTWEWPGLKWDGTWFCLHGRVPSVCDLSRLELASSVGFSLLFSFQAVVFCRNLSLSSWERRAILSCLHWCPHWTVHPCLVAAGHEPLLQANQRETPWCSHNSKNISQNPRGSAWVCPVGSCYRLHCVSPKDAEILAQVLQNVNLFKNESLQM